MTLLDWRLIGGGHGLVVVALMLSALAGTCGGGGSAAPAPSPAPGPAPGGCAFAQAPAGMSCPSLAGAWTAQLSLPACGASTRMVTAQVTQNGCAVEVTVPGLGRAVGNLDGNTASSPFWTEFEAGLPGAATCDDLCGSGGLVVTSSSAIQVNFAGESATDPDCCWNTFIPLTR